MSARFRRWRPPNRPWARSGIRTSAGWTRWWPCHTRPCAWEQTRELRETRGSAREVLISLQWDVTVCGRVTPVILHGVVSPEGWFTAARQPGSLAGRRKTCSWGVLTWHQVVFLILLVSQSETPTSPQGSVNPNHKCPSEIVLPTRPLLCRHQASWSSNLPNFFRGVRT